MTNKNAPEKVAEQAFVAECGRRGYYALKMEIPSWRNWPDRQVLLGFGYTFFIEFKRVGEEPNRGQKFRHKELRAAGYSVYTCYSLAEGLEALEAEIQKALLV